MNIYYSDLNEAIDNWDNLSDETKRKVKENIKFIKNKTDSNNSLYEHINVNMTVLNKILKDENI